MNSADDEGGRILCRHLTPMSVVVLLWSLSWSCYSCCRLQSVASTLWLWC